MPDRPPTIDEYMDAAKARLGIHTDTGLARALGAGHGNPSHWRHRRAHPGDDVMVRLAELAGRDPATALIHLNIWRATTRGRARDVYRQIGQRLAGAALIALAALNPGVAPPGTGAEQQRLASRMLYIMGNIRRILFAASLAVFGPAGKPPARRASGA